MEKFTDQYFTYRQTPVSYDGIGNITRINGNTLVWNQLIQNGNFESASGWSVFNSSYASIGVASNVLTETITQNVSSTGNSYNLGLQKTGAFTDATHNYLLIFDVTPSFGTKIRVELGGSFKYLTDTITANSKTKVTAVIQPSTYNRNLLLYPYGNTTGTEVIGQTLKYENVMLIDVTVNGFTYDQFKSLYPLPYYPYDRGSLLSFMGSGIKTTGKNLIKLSADKIFSQQRVAVEYTDSGAVFTANGTYARVGFTFDTRVGETYTISFKGSSDGDYKSVYLSNEAGWSYRYRSITLSTTERVDRVTFTATSDVLMVGFYITATGSTGTMTISNLQLEFGSAVTDFVPFASLTTNLPVLTYFPTGMKSAGSVYDELTPSKAITRIGSRAYQSGDESNTSVITDGTNTYYALATPTEQNVDLRLMFSSYANGTEQLLPTSDTTPFFGDIEYYNGTEGETNIRKFWLINGENERWDLTEKEFKAFLNNPQGLGFRKTVESVRYGERQNKVSETYNFPQPQGELLFYDSYNSTRYDKYNKFIRFLMNQPITLYYMIPVSYISGIANIYTLDCEVTEVQKTESKNDNILRSSIVFNGMEFYKGDSITVNGTGTSYTLTNDGDFPVGFEITVEGNLTNPYVTLSQDGELYGEAKFDSETAFSSVYVNSNDGEQNVVLMQNDAIIPNPLSYQDLSISNGSIYVTFVKLARGESTLEIGMESGSLTSVKIEFTPMYRSV